MRKYQLDDFPFEDPEIAHALARALAALLWNSVAKGNTASSISKEQARQHEEATEEPGEIENNDNEPDQQD